MPRIITLDQINSIINSIDVIAAMEAGFIQYSNGNAVVPPVGELILENPPGEVHIKYGYIKNDDYYVIKIASGFYDNPKLGLPSGQGMMLLFSQKTGELVSVLLDEGHLTNIRTAAAGALAAKYFAPTNIDAIGVVGTGVQAKLQLLQIQENNPCKSVWLWGRNKEHAEILKSDLDPEFDITIASSPAEVAQNANLIVTTTPSEIPLVKDDDLVPGTLIVAVGSDTQDKQELESVILKNADLVISDSIPQSKSRGEIYRAVKDGELDPEKVVELGTAIQDTSLQRTSNDQTIVVDLTGGGVQDIMIAAAVYTKIKEAN